MTLNLGNSSKICSEAQKKLPYNYKNLKEFRFLDQDENVSIRGKNTYFGADKALAENEKDRNGRLEMNMLASISNLAYPYSILYLFQS